MSDSKRISQQARQQVKRARHAAKHLPRQDAQKLVAAQKRVSRV